MERDDQTGELLVRQPIGFSVLWIRLALLQPEIVGVDIPMSIKTLFESSTRLLQRLLTVDGATSGLDADLLDGNHATAFDPAGSASTVAGNLTTHTNRTDNPHTVTAAQAGAVPYSGATGNVDLNGMSLSNLGKMVIGSASGTYRLDVKGTSATDGISTDIGLNLSYVLAAPAPSLALINSAGNVNAGIHYYTVTYTTAIGETNVVAYSSITTDTNNGQVTVTIPVSSDPRVTGRKIYRSAANLYNYNSRLLGTVADNTTVTYIDNLADSTLGVECALRTNTTNKSIMTNSVTTLVADVNLTRLGTGSLALTTGGRHTLVGSSAGVGITTSADNTFVGHTSGAGAGVGGGNTAIGSYALAYGASSCASNTAVGAYTLQSTTTINNTALGMYAGIRNTSGSNNTLIGYGVMLATGNRSVQTNTVVGANAGYTLTGDGCVFLGFSAGYYETGSNKLYISNSNTTTPLIYGDFATPAVTINGTLKSTGRLNIPTATPASSSAAGTAGDVCWDANYVYICTAAGTWKRAAISTW
jgi:hypothetical protein